jgi:hypothetical protein
VLRAVFKKFRAFAGSLSEHCRRDDLRHDVRDGACDRRIGCHVVVVFGGDRLGVVVGYVVVIVTQVGVVSVAAGA